MVIRHTVRTRHKRYHVPEYERGSGSKVEPSREEHRGVMDWFVRGGPSTELTSEERELLPDSAFAEDAQERSERAYPVPTVAQLRKVGAAAPETSGPRHALNALQRSTQHASPSVRGKVHELVRTRYPAVYAEWERNRR